MVCSNLPVSYGAAALYGLDIERDVPDFMESYERAEDSAIARERDEADQLGEGGFTHPCPLKEILE